MVHLTDPEIVWLQNAVPGLSPTRESRHSMVGTYRLAAAYKGETLFETFEIRIDFRYNFPVVYETGGKILRWAKLINRNPEDMHIYSNGQLCLIRPDKILDVYPNGFDIRTFVKHLQSHFYWVTYVYNYGREPWIAEEHGMGDFDFKKFNRLVLYGRK